MSSYKVMCSILTEYNPTIYEKLSISKFMFGRYLAGNRHSLMLSNVFNMYNNIPVELQYDISKKVFNGKIKSITYQRNPLKNNDETVKLLKEHYNLSLDKAIEYHSFMSETDKKNLHDLYKNGKIK